MSSSKSIQVEVLRVPNVRYHSILITTYRDEEGTPKDKVAIARSRYAAKFYIKQREAKLTEASVIEALEKIDKSRQFKQVASIPGDTEIHEFDGSDVGGLKDFLSQMAQEEIRRQYDSPEPESSLNS